MSNSEMTPAPTNPEQVGCPSCTNTPGKLYTSSHDGRTYIRDCPSCHGTGKVAAKPHLVCAAHQRPLGYCDECRNAVNAAASRPAPAPVDQPDELEDAVIDAVIAEFGSPLRVYEPGLEREAAKAKIDRIAAKVVAAHTRTIAREREAAAKEFAERLFGPLKDESGNYYPGQVVTAADIEEALVALTKGETK